MNNTQHVTIINIACPPFMQWVMTDARHDSCVNAYHTTVPCIAGGTHKVVGVKTLSRFEHGTAQTRECVAIVAVLDDVIARGEVLVQLCVLLCDSNWFQQHSIHRLCNSRSGP